MKRSFIETEDGSITLFVPQLNEHYHSVHGAIQESRHIFIQAGIEYYGQNKLTILEAGFGTGLNAYLSLIYAEEHQCRIEYTTIEKYPLSPDESKLLNYAELIPFSQPELFERLHTSSWNTPIQLTPNFILCKIGNDIREAGDLSAFDIVFYDAFNPEVQPHLWTEDIFRHFFEALKPGGILVTYCVKGIVKQALRNAGFIIKRLPGPPGKREMLRATRPNDRIQKRITPDE